MTDENTKMAPLEDVTKAYLKGDEAPTADERRKNAETVKRMLEEDSAAAAEGVKPDGDVEGE